MKYLLHHTIDAAAETCADRTAFACHPRSISYAELAAKTNQLANRLVEEGVRRGDRVGIYMPRCLESAVAVYGILKAGAAFVPMDPQSPLSRLDSIVEHCGVRHIISVPAMANKVRGLCETPPRNLQCVIGVAGQHEWIRFASWDEVATADGRLRQAAGVMESDLAYIMYTSGSTGAPKGIMHTHYSGLSYARLSAGTYGINGEDRIANHSPLHFDMSTLGYLTAPHASATTVIIPDAYTKLPASLTELIEREQITVWYSVPLALNQMLTGGVLHQRDFSALRWVLFGGEPIAPKTLQSLIQLWPQARFSNVYGPAEVNQCTYFHLPESEHGRNWPADQPIPLGGIWDDTEGLVLDAAGNLVSDGGVGELVVRTPTMMQGYWSRPDLNENAFHKLVGEGGFEKVYYRTGDLVREDERGRLFFVGRKDRQIKVRGHRVELDEVEGVLSAHPSIAEAGVFHTTGPDGETVIRAACIPVAGHNPGEPELLKFASLRLPPYALPADIQICGSLPRTGTGKIDRTHLADHVPSLLFPVPDANGQATTLVR